MILSDNVKKSIIAWFSCFYVFTTGSILFGWPAIYPILVDEGQYSELCVSNETSSSSSSVSPDAASESDEGHLCPEQKVRLNLIFTLGYLFVGFSNLCGILTDRIGPKLSNIIGTSSVISGLIMWTFSDSKATDLWIPGAIFLGFGGSLTFYANFHIVNLLTTYRTLVVSLMSGIWNAGGLNMCLVQYLYFHFDVPRKLSFMCVDIFVITLFLIGIIFLCPFKPYAIGDKPEIKPIWVEIREYLEERKKKKKKIIKETEEVVEEESIELTKRTNDVTYRQDDDNEHEETGFDNNESEQKVKHPKLRYFVRNFFSKKFFAVLAFGLAGGYTISYGLGTMEYQFADLTDKGEMYDQMFSVVACLGLVIIPLWSFVINKFGLYVFGICLACMEALFYGALVTRWMPAIVFDFFLFSFVRINSMTSQIQTPLVNFVLKTLRGKWMYPNIVFMLIPLFSVFFIISSYRFEKRRKEMHANKDDDEEARNLIHAGDDKRSRDGSSNFAVDYYDDDDDDDRSDTENDDIATIVSSPEPDKND